MQLISGGDVREKPDGLFINFLFRMVEQRSEMREGVAVKDDLRLLVSSGYDVADGTQRGRLNFDLETVSMVKDRKIQ